ncbi:MAG: DUF6745 domain-containing protein, partial [Cyanobacteria bacterium J06629_18]
KSPISTELASKQEKLVSKFRNKWFKIALSTERIDKKKAKKAIKAAYQYFTGELPEIIFVDSPKAALKELYDIGCDYLNFSIKYNLRHPLINYPYESFHDITALEKGIQIEGEISDIVLEKNIIYTQLKYDVDKEEIGIPDDDYVLNGIQTDFLIAECCFYDFCISVLKLPHNQQKWKTLKNIVQYCGWVFDYKSVCIVSNRPIKLCFDEYNNLHAEEKPAIEYADGFKVYAHHGVWIPEKYGSIPSPHWKSQWLLEEENAELRRVLIQSIGYNRICEELGAIELDSWQKYTLLKIENYTEIQNPENSQDNSEPMYLLKMLCPSTEHIHFLRVPPNITSAREAITWINWGIYQEEFEIQT